ncbi:MAG: biotin/lipoyl-containing protein, partial [Dermatophilaceae bacterium]
MTFHEFRLPDPGEGLTEAEIVTWRVAPGDRVTVNDIIVEIETAKSLVELPVPFTGTIGSLLVAEGDTVAVGTPIITVDDGIEAATPPAESTNRAILQNPPAKSSNRAIAQGDAAPPSVQAAIEDGPA